MMIQQVLMQCLKEQSAWCILFQLLWLIRCLFLNFFFFFPNIIDSCSPSSVSKLDVAMVVAIAPMLQLPAEYLLDQFQNLWKILIIYMLKYIHTAEV